MIELDTGHYPLLIARWTGTVSAADYHAHAREMEPILARAQREHTYLALAVDASQQQEVEPQARKAMADTAHPSAFLIGTWVTMGAAAKLVLTALKWLGAKNLGNLTPCSSMSDAVSGAANALRRKGVSLSPATESMLAKLSAA